MPIDHTQPYDPANPFARILRGELTAERVLENEWAVAFRDLHPQTAIHVLVIPRGSYVSWDDFSARGSAEEIAGFVRAVGETARTLGLPDGYRLLANVGRDGGQEVGHLHVHLFGGEPLGPMLAR